MWTPSHYRAGDLVEICSKEEILATLDEHGCVDGLPFMPEMLRFCGQQFPVRAVAHKTCDTAHRTYKNRRLGASVHLADLRCDGSAHGGCEAACTLFWKDVWLKPVCENVAFNPSNEKPRTRVTLCSEEQLNAKTQLPIVSSSGGSCYSCQATKLYDATQSLAWWNLRQYILDVTTGNHSMSRVLRVLWLASLRQLWRVIRHVPLVRRPYAAFNEWMHQLLTGREAPYLFKKVKPCVKTPTGCLDLKPGELVRVKSKIEIEKTINDKGLNRGLSFDPEEMAPYCGRVFRVGRCVTRILDELTGKMIQMKHPCIILEGVVCNAEYTRCRLNCPRAIPAYWRELWLERIEKEPEGYNRSRKRAMRSRIGRRCAGGMSGLKKWTNS
jgi:hypothetical protein